MGITLDARLRQALTVYEAGGVKALRERIDAWPPTKGWVDRVVGACADAESEVPASWLLWEYVQTGLALGRLQTAALTVNLHNLQHRDARLHAARCLPYFDLNDDQLAVASSFLKSCTRANYPFLRAWSVDSLVRLAAHAPRLEAEARRALARAEVDAAASVRARARRIRNERGR